MSCPYQTNPHFITVCNTCTNPPHCDIFCRGTSTYGDGYVHCCAGCDCNDEVKCLSPGTPPDANYTDPGGTCSYGCFSVSQPGIGCPSNRNIKENFASVDPKTVLDRIASLPISTWNYITQPDAVRHIGPMAQDFAAAFGVGEDDRHIHVLDGQGVALAAIQGLLQKVEEDRAAQQERIGALEAQNAALQARLEVLERGAHTRNKLTSQLRPMTVPSSRQAFELADARWHSPPSSRFRSSGDGCSTATAPHTEASRRGHRRVLSDTEVRNRLLCGEKALGDATTLGIAGPDGLHVPGGIQMRRPIPEASRSPPFRPHGDVSRTPTGRGQGSLRPASSPAAQWHSWWCAQKLRQQRQRVSIESEKSPNADALPYAHPALRQQNDRLRQRKQVLQLRC